VQYERKTQSIHGKQESHIPRTGEPQVYRLGRRGVPYNNQNGCSDGVNANVGGNSHSVSHDGGGGGVINTVNLFAASGSVCVLLIPVQRLPVTVVQLI
jgi:hypothetical protein